MIDFSTFKDVVSVILSIDFSTFKDIVSVILSIVVGTIAILRGFNFKVQHPLFDY